MKKQFVFSFYCILLVLFSSCDLPVKTSLNNSSTVTAVKKNELFQKQNEASKVFIFETNNEEYLKESGYTLWSENFVNTSESFERVVCKVLKRSGDSKAGYGIVFCCSTKSAEDNYLLTVMINKEGEYNVGKVKDGFFSSISNGWKECNCLNHATENTIEVNYMTAGDHINEFELKLNDIVVTYFADSENVQPVFKNSKYGFVTCIGPSEDFDYAKVNVKFEMMN